MTSRHPAGKGSRYRPVDKAKYDENYERIFRGKSPRESDFQRTEQETETTNNKEK